MKKVALFLTIVAGIALSACSGSKDHKTTDDKTKSATEDKKADTKDADTIVVEFGTVSVDSISPDSAAIVVQDTTVQMIAVPDEKEKK